MFICTLYFVIAQVDFDHQSCMKGSGDTTPWGHGAGSDFRNVRDSGGDPMLEVVGIWWNRAKHRAKSIRI